jgi:hypothetical protein
MKRLGLFAVLSAAAVSAGCSNAEMNNPFHKSTKEEMLAASARRGYQEIRRDKVIFVVGTPQAAERVKGGMEPASKVTMINAGPDGEKVIFEASKEGLENGLIDEFERRHKVEDLNPATPA